jgi:hypothetical protein
MEEENKNLPLFIQYAGVFAIGYMIFDFICMISDKL